MSDENKNEEINNEPNKIKFDFDQAKTSTQQSLEMEDAVASGQELDEESPTQHKFVRFRGKSWDDLLKVHGVKLSGPDGEDIKYVVQITDPTTFSKVNMMCDTKLKNMLSRLMYQIQVLNVSGLYILNGLERLLRKDPQ